LIENNILIEVYLYSILLSIFDGVSAIHDRGVELSDGVFMGKHPTNQRPISLIISFVTISF
jgi:hypothetical protein